jgi:hypothetical protein
LWARDVVRNICAFYFYRLLYMICGDCFPFQLMTYELLLYRSLVNYLQNFHMGFANICFIDVLYRSCVTMYFLRGCGDFQGVTHMFHYVGFTRISHRNHNAWYERKITHNQVSRPKTCLSSSKPTQLKNSKRWQNHGLTLLVSI